MPVEIIRYTKEQLLHLKDSPLVHKPDGLPSIEQWMEVPQEQQTTQRKGRTQGGRGDDQSANQENGAQRHSLFPGKHLTRHSSTAPEDIVLGPPKTAFASSSRAAKSSEHGEKDDEVTAERVNIRDKFFKERENERNKNGAVNGRRANREEGEGWTNVRGRRTSFPAEDGERPQRMGRFARETDGEETTPRRKKFEQPWGRESTEKEGEGTHKSWRDRRDDRWTRGNERIEEDPEWIDAAPKKKDEIGMARFSRNKGPEWLNDDPKDDKKVHTQEDFQRWKERMKAGAAVAEDKENTPEPPSAKDTPVSSKPITPMVIEGKDMFGMWGAAAVKQSEAPSTTEGAPVPKAKPQKSSKFAKLFSPQEEQMPPQPPLVEQQPPPTSQTPADSEDKEGFQRILNLLSNSSISQGQQSPAPNGRSQGTPDRNTIHAQPQPTRHHLLRSREEKAGFIESVLSRGTPTDFKGPQGSFGPFSPATDPGQEQPIRSESIRSGEERLGRATPNSNGMHQFGIQGMMGPQGQVAPPATLSRDREFLLNLMTGPQRNTPPQPTQARPPPPPDMFAGAFMDKKVPFMEPPAMGVPQPPRGNPPPGLFEERQFPENDVRYQPQPPRRMPENPEIENAMRRASRFNLPIHLDDPAIAHIQRRNTADGGMPRNQTHNMGIPQQPPPDQMWTMKPPGLQQPGMQQQPQERPNASMAPPPGFPASSTGPQVRGPPGWPPGMGPPPFSAGNTPLGHPGLQQVQQVQRGPPGGGPPAGSMPFPGQGPPPHGYFAPPGPPPGPPPGFGGPGGPPGGPMGLGLGAQGQPPPELMGMRAGGPPPGMIAAAAAAAARGPPPPHPQGPNGFDMFDRSGLVGRGSVGGLGQQLPQAGNKGGSYRL
ncbi:hypothetical protein IWZ01DRAFT_247820 [Phyllosticta capitalensis]